MKLISIILISILLIASIQATSPQWKQLPNRTVPPPDRALAALSKIGNSFFVFGGHLDCVDSMVINNQTSCVNKFYNDLWQYRLSNGQWTDKSALSVNIAPRSYLSYATWEDGRSMLIYGGTNYNGTSKNVDFPHLKSYSDFWQYDSQADQMILLSNNTGPGVRILAGLAVREDTAYLFGGMNQFFATKNDLWSFDLISKTWTLLLPNDASRQPGPRYALRFLYNEYLDRLIIASGDGSATSPNSVLYSDVWLLNPDTFHVDLVTEGVLPQIHSGAGSYKDVFTYLGGEIREQEALECVNDTFNYEGNPTNKQWMTGLDLNVRPQLQQVFPALSPQNLKQVSSCSDGNDLYLAFGFDFLCALGEGSGQITPNRHIWSFDMNSLR